MRLINIVTHFWRTRILKLPKWTIVAAGLLVMMVLGACSSSYGSPENASSTFMKAFEAQDEDRLEESVCEDVRDDLYVFGREEGVEEDFSFDVRFNASDENDDTAVVDVYGTIRARFITDEQDAEFKLHSLEDNPLFTITLTKDGDDWKVCDPIVVSGAFFSPIN